MDLDVAPPDPPTLDPQEPSADVPVAGAPGPEGPADTARAPGPVEADRPRPWFAVTCAIALAALAGAGFGLSRHHQILGIATAAAVVVWAVVAVLVGRRT